MLHQHPKAKAIAALQHCSIAGTINRLSREKLPKGPKSGPKTLVTGPLHAAATIAIG
jgi:hypothetical protein